MFWAVISQLKDKTRKEKKRKEHRVLFIEVIGYCLFSVEENEACNFLGGGRMLGKSSNCANVRTWVQIPEST